MNEQKIKNIFRNHVLEENYDVAIDMMRQYLFLNIHDSNEYLVRNACKRGLLNVVQWIFRNFNNVDIHAGNDFSLAMACQNNHYQVVKWLLDNFILFKKNVVSRQFYNKCIDNNIEIAKLLYRTYPYLIFQDNNNLMIDILKRELLDVAKWLILVCPTIDLKYNNNESYIYALEHNHVNVINWLTQMNAVDLND